MNLKKKLAAAVTVLAIVAMVGAAAVGTIAFFTDDETAHNVITSGGIDIILNDKTIDENDGLVDFPRDGIPGVMPGVDVDKLVDVTNAGNSQSAWVRILLSTRITDADGNELPIVVKNADGNEVPAVTINFAEGTAWFQGTDGAWYYGTALAPGETTAKLFETVTFAPELGNEYQGCTAQVIVTAQAVQAANNPIPEGGTAENISGWPAA